MPDGHLRYYRQTDDRAGEKTKKSVEQRQVESQALARKRGQAKLKKMEAKLAKIQREIDEQKMFLRELDPRPGTVLGEARVAMNRAEEVRAEPPSRLMGVVRGRRVSLGEQVACGERLVVRGTPVGSEPGKTPRLILSKSERQLIDRRRCTVESEALYRNLARLGIGVRDFQLEFDAANARMYTDDEILCIEERRQRVLQAYQETLAKRRVHR